jgi:hypothetical protein
MLFLSEILFLLSRLPHVYFKISLLHRATLAQPLEPCLALWPDYYCAPKHLSAVPQQSFVQIEGFGID